MAGGGGAPPETDGEPSVAQRRLGERPLKAAALLPVRASKTAAAPRAVLTNAQVVTQLEAFEVLFGLQAWLLASGGVAGCEGAVVMALEGPGPAVKRAFEFTESLAVEAPVH